MHKFFYLLLFFVVTQNSYSYAQSHKAHVNQSTTNDYYICISGINARADIEWLENTIQKKTGITYFLADKFPPNYFLLKSTKPISQEEFNSWLAGRSYKVEFYGVGLFDKEKALVTGRKLITIRKN